MRRSFCCACGISLIHFVVFSIAGIQNVAADTQPLIFSTWEGFEVDKCASIWLIKRFVDKEAIIKFYPKGEPIKEGIPFDTPDAKFRRYHNMSTFESILRHYQLDDPKLVYTGKIIHDIEVNVWERKLMQETYSVEEEVNKIISNSTGNHEVIEKSVKYFDALYTEISTHKP
jgi:hypothetical protein